MSFLNLGTPGTPPPHLLEPGLVPGPGPGPKTYLRVWDRAKSVEIELSVPRNGYPTYFSINPHDYMNYPEERDKKA